MLLVNIPWRGTPRSSSIDRRIGPNARGSVLLAYQTRQSSPITGIRGARVPDADQSISPVDAYMIFIAEHRDRQIDRLCCPRVGAFPDLGLGIFDRPARIPVFLLRLSGAPVLRDTTFLDRDLLLLGVALLGPGHDGCVDDLPAHCQLAALFERGIEACEEPVNCLGLHKPFAEQPDRGGIWQGAFEPDAQEALKREPVLDLKLGRIV